MRFVLSILFVFSIAAPAAASSVCDDLWFTRNLLFDRNGYCFGSPLGMAAFDNAGCTTKEPGLDAQQREVRDAVMAREKELGCNVNNSRTSLDIALMSRRKEMLDLPIATGFESACIGWRGPDYALHNGTHKDSHVIGRLQTGDQIDYYYDSKTDLNGEPWEFATLRRNEKVIAVGWVHFNGDQDKCAAFAG